MLSQRKDLEHLIEAQRLESLRRVSSAVRKRNPAAQAQTLDGLRYIARQLEGVDDRQLRDASDTLRDQQKLDVVVVAAVNEGKISFVVAARKDAAARGVQALRRPWRSLSPDVCRDRAEGSRSLRKAADAISPRFPRCCPTWATSYNH